MRHSFLQLVMVCAVFASCIGIAEAQDKKLTLDLPNLGDRILELPKVESTRIVVYEPKGWNDFTFHDVPIIASWREKLYVFWHAAERTDSSPPIIGLVSTSSDQGKTWTKPAQYTEEVVEEEWEEDDYQEYMRQRYNISADEEFISSIIPRVLHATKERLYIVSQAFCQKPGEQKRYWRGRVHYTEDGKEWKEIPGEELDSYDTPVAVRNHWGARHFVQMDNKKLVTALSSSSTRAPTTTDLDGLRGWSGGEMELPGVADRTRHPSIWKGPDGTIHYVAEYQYFASRERMYLWHSYSIDNGESWVTLTDSYFYSNQGNAAFGSLPNGNVWHVGTPYIYCVDYPLILAISKDGWTFSNVRLLRDEEFDILYPWANKGVSIGYLNPDAVYKDGKLYVVYAISKDLIELSIVDISHIMD